MSAERRNMDAPIAGVVLAGGRSLRMGGGDKGLKLLAGRPILAHVIDRLRPQVQQLALNANGDPQRLEAFGLDVIADPVGEFAGPLAGVLAAMRWAGTKGCERVATAASDTPFLPSTLVHDLSRAAGGRDRIAAPRSDRRPHPVFALWPVTAAEALEAFLQSGRKARVLDFIGEHDHVFVDFEPMRTRQGRIDPFFNINTPDDLRTAEDLAAELLA